MPHPGAPCDKEAVIRKGVSQTTGWRDIAQGSHGKH